MEKIYKDIKELIELKETTEEKEKQVIEYVQSELKDLREIDNSIEEKELSQRWNQFYDEELFKNVETEEILKDKQIRRESAKIELINQKKLDVDVQNKFKAVQQEVIDQVENKKEELLEVGKQIKENNDKLEENENAKRWNQLLEDDEIPIENEDVIKGNLKELESKKSKLEKEIEEKENLAQKIDINNIDELKEIVANNKTILKNKATTMKATVSKKMKNIISKVRQKNKQKVEKKQEEKNKNNKEEKPERKPEQPKKVERKEEKQNNNKTVNPIIRQKGNAKKEISNIIIKAEDKKVLWTIDGKQEEYPIENIMKNKQEILKYNGIDKKLDGLLGMDKTKIEQLINPCIIFALEANGEKEKIEEYVDSFIKGKKAENLPTYIYDLENSKLDKKTYKQLIKSAKYEKKYTDNIVYKDSKFKAIKEFFSRISTKRLGKGKEEVVVETQKNLETKKDKTMREELKENAPTQKEQAKFVKNISDVAKETGKNVFKTGYKGTIYVRAAAKVLGKRFTGSRTTEKMKSLASTLSEKTKDMRKEAKQEMIQRRDAKQNKNTEKEEER